VTKASFCAGFLGAKPAAVSVDASPPNGSKNAAPATASTVLRDAGALRGRGVTCNYEIKIHL